MGKPTARTTPSLKRRLKTALTAGLAQAHAGAEAAAELKAAKEAEEIPCKRSKRSHLQRGGVLYAEEARDMVVRRDQNEAKKAREALERAHTAIERAARTERKRFIDAVKRKKLMKPLCLEVRKEARIRANRSKQCKTERMEFYILYSMWWWWSKDS
ncbi:hypothetical protein FN846DRAFT_945060 [Sphaerosporella brunnea]|uniref:Uncharacterized protein n=1 Tax=Sphaerosporella brunnea TaxID=1250544 RepID=A0A5J5F008_9PEZI|nr:hypothetical protein FN846DRAFT_945060 [Sphaerosporella brunnea]